MERVKVALVALGPAASLIVWAAKLSVTVGKSCSSTVTEAAPGLNPAALAVKVKVLVPST